MQNVTDITRPVMQNVTDIAKPISGSAGRFGFGVFGKARFGESEGMNPVVRPAVIELTNEIARPA